MKNLFIPIVIVFVLVAGFLFYKNKPSKVDQTSRIAVTTSFYPLYFFASQIGGDKVSVVNITPAGSEPHDYEPTTADIAKIQNSKLLILNGGVEAWGDKIKSNLGPTTTIVIAAEELLTQQVEEDGQNVQDPHVWLDPILAKAEVEKISQALVSIDSQDASYYQKNTQDLEAKLDLLNTQYKQGLANCGRKDVITSHAAFGYLSSRYGLNQVSIAGLSPDEEPSLKQLSAVSQFAKANNVKYIFFESLVSPKLSETIANEVGAKTLVLNPLEGLTDDETGQGADYFSVMRQNLENLKIALECKT
ncbi:MAG TPA: zinc ABC transporter substrate-binding protein [Candidatus Saccharimonadales bacterium]|nr:zinc ABC transporter substrate-binding protein [Candidatus Saccharimonadales bacterium]